MIYSGTKIVDILDNLIHECLNGVSFEGTELLRETTTAAVLFMEVRDYIHS